MAYVEGQGVNLRTYFVSGRDNEGNVFADVMDAPDFESDFAMALRRAWSEFGMRPFRITSVTEQPRIEQSGPLALMLRFVPRGKEAAA